MPNVQSQGPWKSFLWWNYFYPQIRKLDIYYCEAFEHSVYSRIPYIGVYLHLLGWNSYTKNTLMIKKMNKTIHSGSQGGLQVSITPSPGSMMTSSDLCEHQACMWCTYIQTSKTFITHLNFLNYLRLIYFHYVYACLIGDLCMTAVAARLQKRSLDPLGLVYRQLWASSLHVSAGNQAPLSEKYFVLILITETSQKP